MVWNTTIQTSNQKDKGLAQQGKGGKQGRSLSSFYQQVSIQPTSPEREEEQGKQLEETIFPKLQDSKNPKGCHRPRLQNDQKIDGIKGKRGTKNETTPF
ncbi:hypothetical protein O181_010326 [Austropuccinia psidii MF-1]|uniref:Uncharacterized protein n=1 Tax=Austropuccinia psidii MF-1 TaxID=1389203 RepID=A0A9Q3BQT8_9BASI|nr:hypothetical protein [Austropuccinia psidii MF-1]